MHQVLDQAILDLVHAEAIPDQAVLGQRLTDLGLEVSQPSLSRRLRKLNIVKRDGRYRHDPSEAPLKPSVRIFPAPPNLLILKTQPGFAQAVGAVLDDKPLTAQVGTVAGDDTVMVVLGDPSRMDAAIEEGRRRFGAVVVSATS
ncbi:MAG: hypothetical protein KDI71_19345 [Xanthomonadales bacterium]|nr:hypothetical protein [Xanthomonadales bacterium]